MIVEVLKRTVLALAMLAAAVSGAPAAAQDAAGDWVGVIEPAPGSRVPLVLHIERDNEGALQGTMDSPLQGAHGIPLADIAVEAGRITFAAPTIGGRYQGEWDVEANAWEGEWTQAEQSWPLSFSVPSASQPLSADWQLPSNEQIAALLAARSAPRAGQGIVVGILDGNGRRIVTYGPGENVRFDGDTLFEIGSITKVFTALILADMVNEGEVALDDPVAGYLPANRAMPEREGKPITLRDLATHRSGLPRMADDMATIADPGGPFADYSEERLLGFLSRYELSRDPDAAWEYSNLGAGLLGYVLGRAAGSDYATLLRERIIGPLGMTDTAIELNPAQEARFAPAFDAYMRPADLWNFAAMVGAGGIRSSASDMLTFAAAVLDPDSPIAAAVETALSVRLPGEAAAVEQALGWQAAQPLPGRELLLHSGGTGGFRAILALEPATGRAVVALANSAAEPSVIDLALHMLLGTPVAPTPSVPPAPAARSEIALTATQLDKFVGLYDFGDGFVLALTRDGSALRARREDISGAPPLRIFPEAPLVFFWKDVDAELRFTVDASGTVTGAELEQGDVSLTGIRLQRESPTHR